MYICIHTHLHMYIGSNPSAYGMTVPGSPPPLLDLIHTGSAPIKLKRMDNQRTAEQ